MYNSIKVKGNDFASLNEEHVKPKLPEAGRQSIESFTMNKPTVIKNSCMIILVV
jgi:hypothetical protein